MVTTPELIETLCAHAQPVRRLRPPLVRAGLWLLAVGLILILLASLYGPRPDLAELLRQPTFAAALAASLLTGVLAAVAAFQLSLPDRSRWWLLLPVPSLVLWVSTVGYGCLTAWISIGPAGVRLGPTLECFATLLLASVPSFVVLVAMLRHAARLYPTTVAMMGGLASAGVAATALSLFHEIDASALVLLWTLGTTAVIVALSGIFARRLFAGLPGRAIVCADARVFVAASSPCTAHSTKSPAWMNSLGRRS